MTNRMFSAIFLSLVLSQAICAAQSAPPSFVYKITMGAGPGSGSMDYTMDVAIKSTNPDGSRAVSLTIHGSKMPMINNKTMDATLTPFGAIAVGSTGEMPKSMNPYSIAQQKQMMQAAGGPMLQMMLNPLNAFAGGLSSAPSFKNGATWHADSSEVMTEITYTVTGHEVRNGRDTAVITMKSAAGGPSVTGQGNYDPAAHLVIAVHCEIRQTATDKQGQILDVAMTP